MDGGGQDVLTAPGLGLGAAVAAFGPLTGEPPAGLPAVPDFTGGAFVPAG